MEQIYEICYKDFSTPPTPYDEDEHQNAYSQFVNLESLCLQDQKEREDSMRQLLDDIINQTKTVVCDDPILYDLVYYLVEKHLHKDLEFVLSFVSSIFNYQYDKYYYTDPVTQEKYFFQSILEYACFHSSVKCIDVIIKTYDFYQQVDSHRNPILPNTFMICLKKQHFDCLKCVLDGYLRSYRNVYDRNPRSSLFSYYGRYKYSDFDEEQWSNALKEVDWPMICKQDPWWKEHMKWLFTFKETHIITHQFDQAEKDCTILLMKEWIPLSSDILKYVVKPYL